MLHTDRSGNDDALIGQHFRADPVALTPQEEAACIILDREVALVELDHTRRIVITRGWRTLRPAPRSTWVELGRAPHHECGRPIGTTALPIPAPKAPASEHVCPPDGCQPPF